MFTGRDAVAALDRVLQLEGGPASITLDHGIEFMSKALEAWVFDRGVQLDFTRPGKPTDNSHIESLSGRLRDNVPMSSSSCRWRTPARSSKPGGSITVSRARTAPSAS